MRGEELTRFFTAKELWIGSDFALEPVLVVESDSELYCSSKMFKHLGLFTKLQFATRQRKRRLSFVIIERVLPEVLERGREISSRGIVITLRNHDASGR